jgi:hypothetical protein
MQAVNVDIDNSSTGLIPGVGFGPEIDTTNLQVYIYSGPSPALQSLVGSVISQGDVLPVSPPVTNASWHLELNAPFLRCGNLTEQDRIAVSNNIKAAMLADTFLSGFLAWRQLPLDSAGAYLLNATLPFRPAKASKASNSSIFNPQHLRFESNADFHTNDLNVTLPLLFYLAVVPPWAYGTALSQRSAEEVLNRSSIIQCQLLNSTYLTTFSAINNTQKVSHIVKDIQDNPILRVPVVATTSAVYNYGRPLPYDADESPCDSSKRSCYWNSEILPTLSYQAIVDAFSKSILGSVALIGSNTQGTLTSEILNTVLSRSPEILTLQKDRQSHWRYEPSLQQRLLGQNASLVHGMVYEPNVASHLSLAANVEELFQNVTLSLFSSRFLQ